MSQDKNTRQKSENKQNNSSRGGVKRLLLPIFVIGFIACLIIVIKNINTKKTASDTYSDMQDSVNATIDEQGGVDSSEESSAPAAIATESTAEEEDVLAELGIEIPEKAIDWDMLWQENDDIYAWIYIPGTNVDYPILQHKTEQDFYLDHNVDGSSGYPGCIYTQLRNKKDFTDFATIIYGHDMRDGSMFQNLHNYEDSRFFEENQYIYIYTPDKVFVYRIFAAVTFHDRNILMYYDMEETSDRAGYINDIKACNGMTDQYDDTVTVNTESHIVSLSTCIGSKPDNRWIVSGVLLNE